MKHILIFFLFPFMLFSQSEPVYTFIGEQKIHYYPDDQTETFEFNTFFKLTKETFEVETPYSTYKMHVSERYEYCTKNGFIISIITETSSYDIYIIKKLVSVIIEKPSVGVRKIEYVKKSVKI